MIPSYITIYIYIWSPPLEPPHTNISCIFTVKILYKKKKKKTCFNTFCTEHETQLKHETLQPMAHSAGSLNLTKALYKRLLHGGVLGGGEHMYIYILYSHESPFIKNAVVGSPRLNAGVIDAAASRAAPAAPISPLRQRGGLPQATAGTRHDTVMARSTVNDLVINKR